MEVIDFQITKWFLTSVCLLFTLLVCSDVCLTMCLSVCICVWCVSLEYKRGWFSFQYLVNKKLNQKGCSWMKSRSIICHHFIKGGFEWYKTTYFYISRRHSTCYIICTKEKIAKIAYFSKLILICFMFTLHWLILTRLKWHLLWKVKF